MALAFQRRIKVLQRTHSGPFFCYNTMNRNKELSENHPSKSKTIQIVTTLVKIVSLIYTGLKAWDLYKKLSTPPKPQLSYPERLNAKLQYEEKSAKIKEDHLRKELEIREEFAQKEVRSKEDIQEVRPLRPRQNESYVSIENIEKRRLFASAIHSGENCVVIAPKGVGKTALLMQICSAISEGKPTGLWPAYEDGTQTPQRVLYYDFELTDSDMFERYSRYGYTFPANFERFDRTQLKDAYGVLTDIKWKVEHEMNEGDEVTAVIDNITKALKTEQVSEVNRFNEKMEEVFKLAQKRGIILALISVSHVLTGEYRPGTSISLKEAMGGSNMTNFKNSIIVLEQPKSENYLFVKVLNSRSEPEPENVCILRPLGKDDGTHYHFEYVGEMPEDQALREMTHPFQTKNPEDGEKTPGKGKRDKAWWDAEMPTILERIKAGEKQQEIADTYDVQREYLNCRISQYKKEQKKRGN